MQPICLHDRRIIERVLRKDLQLHLYQLGDLDEFFWPYTTWYALAGAEPVEQLALVYSGCTVPCLLAFCGDRFDDMQQLLAATGRLLPSRLNAHLSPGLGQALTATHQLEHPSAHLKMALTDPGALGPVDGAGVEPLTAEHEAEMEHFLADAYPHHWFEPRMLATGQYVGIREHGELRCVAGVHVYSPTYRVAALGNVATHPEARGQGLAGRACAQLCRQLLGSVDHIGLNVEAGNEAALRCYRRLGFATVARYEECSLRSA